MTRVLRSKDRSATLAHPFVGNLGCVAPAVSVEGRGAVRTDDAEILQTVVVTDPVDVIEVTPLTGYEAVGDTHGVPYFPAQSYESMFGPGFVTSLSR